MKYTFTPPGETGDPCTIWRTISLSLPADTHLATPGDPDRWEQQDGRIIATYTPEELGLAVGLALEQKRAALEVRLERGLAVMEAATGCTDARAERLLRHWQALNDEYSRVLARIQEVNADG
jgi:hypothetical protein